MVSRWDTLPAYLTIRQVAEVLGVHVNTVRNWDRSGKLKGVRMNARGDRRYDKQAVFRLFQTELNRVQGKILTPKNGNGSARGAPNTQSPAGSDPARKTPLKLSLPLRIRARLTRGREYQRWKRFQSLTASAPKRRIAVTVPPRPTSRFSPRPLLIVGVFGIGLFAAMVFVATKLPFVRNNNREVASVSRNAVPESSIPRDRVLDVAVATKPVDIVVATKPTAQPSTGTPQPTTAPPGRTEGSVDRTFTIQAPVAAVPKTNTEPSALAPAANSNPTTAQPSPSETGVVAGTASTDTPPGPATPAATPEVATTSPVAKVAAVAIPAVPPANPFGVTLAWIALVFGTFFFLYSFRYYSIVAVVLALSRSGGIGGALTVPSGNGYAKLNGNGHANGNGYANGNGNGHANGNGNGRGNGYGSAKGFLAGFFKKNGTTGKGFRPGYTGLASTNGTKRTKPSFLYTLFFGDDTKENGNGHANGNGHSNGNANGNGHGNGNGNGYANGNGNGKGYRAGFFGANGNGNGHANGKGHSNGNGYANGNGKINGNGKASYLRFFQGLFKKNGGNGNGYANGNGNGNGKPPGMWWDLSGVDLTTHPFVSVHIPFYNEKKVANRILTATTAFDYPNYEVIVVDDSTDETVQILEKWKRHPKVKVIHRDVRTGFKGGALRQAVAQMDPRTAFVVVFDADFVPYPDTLTQFLRYFRVGNGHSDDYRSSNLAAVQGYQWHVLNKNENWITRGVRAEFAGSYVIERPGTEIFGALKQIAGSVYMIRADVLKKYNWGTSITEDFELTMRIYADGYRVLYTPYVQGPSECVSTLKRLIRQRMRWAEGHTHNVRRFFGKILGSPYLRKREKLEFLYLAPYYLQAVFFMVGTLAWFASDAILHTKLPFWTELWGWSLVFTNMFALPLVNAVGLFLEESPQRDYLGILSFVVLSYVLVPFQAYAALKGLFEKSEGTWFRTPKSGHITDAFFRSRFRRWFGSLFPGTQRLASVRYEQTLPSRYLDLGTANNTFRKFAEGPVYAFPRFRNLARGFTAALLIVTITAMLFVKHVPYVSANPDVYYQVDVAINGSPAPGRGNAMVTTTPGGAGMTMLINSKAANTTANNWWYFSNILPTGGGDATIASGTWSMVSNFVTTNIPAKNMLELGVMAGLINSDGTGLTAIIGSHDNITGVTVRTDASGTVGPYTITSANARRIFMYINWINTAKCTTSCVEDNNTALRVNWLMNDSGGTSNLTVPTVTLPEVSAPRILIFILILLLPALPRIVRRRPPGRPGGGLPDWKEALRALLGRLLGRERHLDDLPV